MKSLLPKKYPVTCHTKYVGKDSTFVAINGHQADGAHYIQQALLSGAQHIVTEKNILLPLKHITHVSNARKALAQLSSKALGDPSKKLKIIGITGTKGKSTTTHIIEHILRYSGAKTALIGGIKNKIINEEEKSVLTTPNSDYLNMFFAECVKQNVEYVVMEVSAHAATLQRVYGIEFEAFGFTNLSVDHLDYYASMDEYYQAKYSLLRHIKQDGTLVINNDDTWCTQAQKSFAQESRKKKISIKSFGFNTNLSLIKNDQSGISFSLDKNIIESPTLFGMFNSYNLSMAFLICKNLGINANTIKQAIAKFSGVPGRLQLHGLKNGAQAFVDFAHNPSSMKAVLSELRSMTNHLIVVFGCGGDRDSSKRPLMGKIATEFGDLVIVTDDNPRTENPQTIVKNILRGISQTEMTKIIIKNDRAQAIRYAASVSHENSIIAILGKGHEEHFLINGKKLFFSDYQTIQQY